MGAVPEDGEPANVLLDRKATIDAAERPTAMGITPRDRSALRGPEIGVAPPRPAATVTPAAPDAATTAPDPASTGHLVPLGGDWALWRWVCLRAAGFAFDLHEAYGAADLAEAADRLNAAAGRDGAATADRAGFDASFEKAERRLSVALHATAADPRFRRAVSWQNRTALGTGIDALLRRDPETVVRNGHYRRYETLVASYMQRYTAKNDTIGFFGPVGWVHVTPDGPPVRRRPLPGGTLARRTLYLEDWAARLLAEALSPGLEPWLVPRRLPLAYVRAAPSGARLELPYAPPVPLSPLDARVMAAIDGGRTANEIAAVVAIDAPQVMAVLARLRDLHAIDWQLDLAADDMHSLRTLRERLGTVTDASRREPALAALDEMDAAVADLDRIGADREDDRLLGGLERLDETFTRLTGAAATRRPGMVYAGRTLVFEESLRGDDVTLGASLFESLAAPLGLVLTAARWYTAATAALFQRACQTAYRERVGAAGGGAAGGGAAGGGPAVPLAELWLDINRTLFDERPEIATPLEKAVRDRWARVFTVPEGVRHVRLRSEDLRDAVAEAFGHARPGWPSAVHHSPDLMLAASSAEAIAAGDFYWVLGELHPGVNTTRYATWIEVHPEPEAIRTAMHADLGRPVIWSVATGSFGATGTRQADVLIDPADRRLVFASDSCGYPADRALFVADFDVEPAGPGPDPGAPGAGGSVAHAPGAGGSGAPGSGGLVAVSRVTGERIDLIELLGDPLSANLTHFFGMVPAAPYTPRISFDNLVVQRETWRFAATDLAWVHVADERARYLAARRFATGHGLPRYVFVRTEGERKPIFADLTSLSSLELLSRTVRRARSSAGDGARVTISEMLPTPDQLWLTDAEARRYTCELRICAADRRGR